VKKLLLVTDLPAGTEESAVDGLFRSRLRDRFTIDVVYCDPALRRAERRQDTLVVPRRALRRGLGRELATVVDLHDYSVGIARNKFYVLRQLRRALSHARVGFWETFPHAYRRVAQAKLERRAIWRKRLEYAWRRRREARLLNQADFFLPISTRHHQAFYPSYTRPVFPLPMGVEDSWIESNPPIKPVPPLRMIYVGTIDALRQIPLMNEAFRSTPGEFRLDYYTASRNASVEAIRACRDPRIRVHPPLPRAQLRAVMGCAHVGITYIPRGRLYDVSSPTKSVEYCAAGLVLLGNPLPDYEEWLDPDGAVLTPFTREGIQAGIRQLLGMTSDELARRGRAGLAGARQHRTYSALAGRLAKFLNQLTSPTP